MIITSTDATMQELAADSITALEKQCLEAVLRAVPFDGWRDAALQHAAKAVPPGAMLCVFPGGIADAFRSWHRALDSAMLEAYAALEPKPLKVHDKIQTLVMARLRAAAEHKEALRAATAHYALPTRWLEGRRYLWQVADAIWRTTRDSSTDYNYYSKRLLLIEVYSACALYILQDDTPDHAATAAFCARRIGDVLELGKKLGVMRRKADDAGDKVTKALQKLGAYAS